MPSLPNGKSGFVRNVTEPQLFGFSSSEYSMVLRLCEENITVKYMRVLQGYLASVT